MPSKLAALPLVAALTLAAHAQQPQPVASPEVMPGKGLAEHPFLCRGEYEHNADQQTVHLVRGGKPVWSYAIKFRVIRDEKADIQELGDCTLPPTGHVLLTTRFGALEVTPDKQVAWTLREWVSPNLGPATFIQLLDQPAGDLQR
ncbi:MULTISPECIES: hypothetical protein [unclassified Roseateles]|uniref:hypothetical protein n=1 Tax=unclassified Roseateles TaxID=2626991 RepID=UPI0006FC72E0|nr:MULTISPECIES: hypothetical protein [unclassified Roseateles]KQW42248.1 hypothetical protein ASC81_20505 [Pelomonas sp. Root405]KRA68121.1 hypothetical protein ASD88_22085 [Pelomonas sp. Root662]